MSRRVVGPINRVEGDLEVRLDIESGEVRDAWVTSPLYRGFEQMLSGRNPHGALVYAPRICGICSVTQSVAAAQALADVEGVEPPANGRLSTNLILANENLADHLTHFYLFFMPDFARDTYSREPWFEMAAERFKAVKGKAGREVLPARADFLHLMGLLAGKWPHTLAIQPGGSTRTIEPQERTRIATLIYAFRRFLEVTLFGDSLETVVKLESADALMAWFENGDPERGDFPRFLQIAESLQLERMGRASDTFMSYGAYNDGGNNLFEAGIWQEGERQPLRQEGIHEDLSHSWMQYRTNPKRPYDGMTVPDASAKESYSWCKAPRLDGRVVEVGALARQVVDGHPLAVDLVKRGGGNVRSRVVARLLELARVTIAMEHWVKEIEPGEPFCNHGELPAEAMGMGMVEAARGGLGHWVKVKNGRILNYQIVAPTTWNFSPRDSQGTPGALEQALVGAPVREDEQDPVSVQHIIRSFDPCMACTVH